MKTQINTTPRLYVGTYAKYNNGSIDGGWLDLEDYTDRESFLEACQELHKDESDPELMFQDFEGFPRAWYCESSAPPEILWEWLELDENEREAFGAYADHVGGDTDIDSFRDAYCGQWDSGAAYAESLAEECGDIPKDLPNWIVIDWEASWNSNLSYDFFEEDGSEGIHIFRNI
jgi:antirestriction protein